MRFKVAHFLGSFPDTNFLLNTFNVLNFSDRFVHAFFCLKVDRKYDVNKFNVFKSGGLSSVVLIILNYNLYLKIKKLVPGLGNFQYVRFIKMKLYGPDIVHVHWVNDFDIVYKVKDLFDENVKILVSFRGIQLSLMPILSVDGLQRLKKILINADGIHSVSADLVNFASFYGGSLVLEKAHVIHPVVLCDLLPYRKRQYTNGLRVIVLANLVWKKGIRYLISAVKLCVNEGINIHVDIFGDGKQYEELIYLVNELKVVDFVKFHGRISELEVRSKLYEANLLIQYSVQEGFSNAVCEAQVSGLPCIVSNAEGLSENVIHNVTGYVVEKQSSVELFECLKEFYFKPIDCKYTMGKAASDLGILRFNEKLHLEKFDLLYSNLI